VQLGERVKKTTKTTTTKTARARKAKKPAAKRTIAAQETTSPTPKRAPTAATKRTKLETAAKKLGSIAGRIARVVGEKK
jgi:hypothetical protein